MAQRGGDPEREEMKGECQEGREDRGEGVGRRVWKRIEKNRQVGRGQAEGKGRERIGRKSLERQGN